jgi:hypothetical protein
MFMKTVQLTVLFFAQVPNDVNNDNLCININKENIEVLDGLSVIKNARVNEYETVMIEEI